MTLTGIPLSTLLVQLEKLVNKSLKLWDIPEDVSAELINVSENFTYRIENPSGFKAFLEFIEKTIIQDAQLSVSLLGLMRFQKVD